MKLRARWMLFLILILVFAAADVFVGYHLWHHPGGPDSQVIFLVIMVNILLAIGILLAYWRFPYWLALRVGLPIPFLLLLVFIILDGSGIFSTWRPLQGPPSGVKKVLTIEWDVAGKAWVQAQNGGVYTLQLLVYGDDGPKVYAWRTSAELVAKNTEILVDKIPRGGNCAGLRGTFLPFPPKGKVRECFYNFLDGDDGGDAYFAFMQDGSIKYWLAPSDKGSFVVLFLIGLFYALFAALVISLIYLTIFLARSMWKLALKLIRQGKEKVTPHVSAGVSIPELAPAPGVSLVPGWPEDQNMATGLKGLPAKVGFTLLAYSLIVLFASHFYAWLAAWIFFVLWSVFWEFQLAWLYRKAPALFQRRTQLSLSVQHGRDKVLDWLVCMFLLSWLLLICFDAGRFHWSPIPTWLSVIGLALLLGAFGLYFLTYREIARFPPLVQVQEEHGQAAPSGGPYRFVRHPLYTAALAVILGASLLLGAGYSVPVGLIIALLLARRALQEESILQRELPGYVLYMQRVKYRLIPFVF